MVDLCADVVKIVCGTFLLDPADVHEDSLLEELGVDSKGRVRLLAALEVHHEVTIGLERLDRFTDIAAVAGVLADALNERTGAGRAS
ncbi:acyl carrier protein [Amycolatopsis sulphurea]|uniref:Acyl carrier protein n=1 Tax=Amycolatopsis sulphurea TaxID=76022 RepID=A0A2A9FJJ8_9PSEU|nr:acyl carrier protein [Amycolatopsis sulphurea]PFG50921.1 acyl carrier protein [Amycolatopsis sulphurea]